MTYLIITYLARLFAIIGTCSVGRTRLFYFRALYRYILTIWRGVLGEMDDGRNTVCMLYPVSMCVYLVPAAAFYVHVKRCIPCAFSELFCVCVRYSFVNGCNGASWYVCVVLDSLFLFHRSPAGAVPGFFIRVLPPLAIQVSPWCVLLIFSVHEGAYNFFGYVCLLSLIFLLFC